MWISVRRIIKEQAGSLKLSAYRTFIKPLLKRCKLAYNVEGALEQFSQVPDKFYKNISMSVVWKLPNSILEVM